MALIHFSSRGKPEYRFLSNFWEASFCLDGVVYRSVEHFFQAQKTDDAQERKKKTPKIGPQDYAAGMHL